MKQQNIQYKLTAIAAIWVLSMIPALAQEPTTPLATQMRQDFSDEELQSFVKANEKVMAIQLEGEQIMIRAIEDEGLTVDRFHQILEEQRDPQRGIDTSTSEQELKSFNDAAQTILQENEKLEKQMASSIEESGLDIETYQMIMLAYHQNPEVQARVNKLLNGDQ